MRWKRSLRSGKNPRFKRDAKNVRDSAAAVLIGVRGTRTYKMNCGACGYITCAELEEAEKQPYQKQRATAAFILALPINEGIYLAGGQKFLER